MGVLLSGVHIKGHCVLDLYIYIIHIHAYTPVVHIYTYKHHTTIHTTFVH